MKNIFLTAVLIFGGAAAQAASVTLYDQDFEAPNGYVNNTGGYSDHFPVYIYLIKEN